MEKTKAGKEKRYTVLSGRKGRLHCSYKMGSPRRSDQKGESGAEDEEREATWGKSIPGKGKSKCKTQR